MVSQSALNRPTLGSNPSPLTVNALDIHMDILERSLKTCFCVVCPNHQTYHHILVPRHLPLQVEEPPVEESNSDEPE